MKDIANVQREAHTFFRIEQDESDSRTINLFLRGPKKSPYEGFEFELRLYFTKDYPYDPPLVHFKTPIYHVNLDKYGNICLDIIDKAKDRWAASMDIQQIASSLSVLLMKPNIKGLFIYLFLFIYFLMIIF